MPEAPSGCVPHTHDSCDIWRCRRLVHHLQLDSSTAQIKAFAAPCVQMNFRAAAVEWQTRQMLWFEL